MHYFRQHQGQEPWYKALAFSQWQSLLPPFSLRVPDYLPKKRIAITTLLYLSQWMAANHYPLQNPQTNPQQPVVFVPGPSPSSRIAEPRSIDSLFEALQNNQETISTTNGQTTVYTLNIPQIQGLPGKDGSKTKSEEPSMEVRRISYTDFIFPPDNPQGEGKGDVLEIEVILADGGKSISKVFKFLNIGDGLYRSSVYEHEREIVKEALIMAYGLLGIPIEEKIRIRKEGMSPNNAPIKRESKPIQQPDPLREKRRRKKDLIANLINY